MSEYNSKYRPQTVTELDLAEVRQSLTQVLSSGKIPHAFLFCGPRGSGKTSAARIVAKAINCQERAKGEIEPCNKCGQCISIRIGNNLDVLEIDAASNRGIDDIRELREKVKLAPSSSKYKVYIIDEVHMLTNEAFNALLKTLEEPPKHVVFILCTTEPEKLPETIVSRCLRINFKKAKKDEVIEKLKKIAEEEKLDILPEALREIARGSQGSFRDALKILEQASFAGEKITEDKVSEILGQATGRASIRLLELMHKKETREALREVDRVAQEGSNLRVYTGQILEALRAALLAKVGDIQDSDFWEGEESLLEELKIEEIKCLIEVFSKAAMEFKEAMIPQLPLELAVVEWCGNGEEKENREKKEDGGIEGTKGGKAGASKDKGEEKTDGKNEESEDLEGCAISIVSLGDGNDCVPLEEVKSRWSELLLGVRPKNFSIEAFLRSARPIDLSGRILTIEVFYGFHKDKLENDKNRRIVEEVASEIFGFPLRIKCVIGEKPELIRETEAPKYTEDVVIENEDIFSMAEKIFTNADKGDEIVN